MHAFETLFVVMMSHAAVCTPLAALATPSTVFEARANAPAVGLATKSATPRALDGYNLNRAYAFITEPNNPSEKLHLLLGFKKIGVLNNVGKKFRKFWNVGVFEYFF